MSQGRQEWPIDVDDSSPFRPLADSINLRMARIMALLACGAAPIDAAPKHGPLWDCFHGDVWR